MTDLAATVRIRRGTFLLDVEIAVAAGEVVAVLGPNGAGKSTLLRVLAGLLPLDAGQVRLGARTFANAAAAVHLAPHRRPVGVVFQDYLLFPHLSVLDNVAFGPRSTGTSKRAARAVAAAWLARMDAADLAGLRPGQLSGGQAQRVALARALATDPDLLVLDEPLTALDARTRLVVRTELHRHLRSFEGATLVVTHDPTDAVVLADRLVVIEAGRVVQSGTPAEVTRRPRTDYVARLVGLNLLTGLAGEHAVRTPGGGEVQVSRTVPAGPCYVAFRPAAVALFDDRPHGSPRNIWPGRVLGLEPYAETVRVEVTGVPGPGETIFADVTPAAVADLGLRPGTAVWASVKAAEIEVYAAEPPVHDPSPRVGGGPGRTPGSPIA